MAEANRCEAKPGSLAKFLSGEKRLKYPAHGGFIHARAGVGDSDAVVRNSARQLADGLDFLGLAQLLFENDALGYVLHHDFDTLRSVQRIPRGGPLIRTVIGFPSLRFHSTVASTRPSRRYSARSASQADGIGVKRARISNSQQFFGGGVTKHVRQRGIHGDEFALQAGPVHSVSGVIHQGAVPRFASQMGLFSALALADIQDASTQQRPGSRRQRHQVNFTGNVVTPKIWIAGKCYSSGAIYSVMGTERFGAWESKRLYCECRACGFAKTFAIGEIERGEKRDCPACGSENTFGEARYWLRPPGFAHPVDIEEMTSPDEIPETSYATRAKLTMETPSDDAKWTTVNERVRVLRERKHLLVSNTGPKRDGYSYCVKCGRIEASSDPTPLLAAPHRKPYPDEKEGTCEESGDDVRHIVLGTDFITDIVLFSMEVAAPLSLRPGQYPTDVALRSVSEALARAASQLLEIEPGELMAEYRPSLTPQGRDGSKQKSSFMTRCQAALVLQASWLIAARNCSSVPQLVSNNVTGTK